MNTNTGNKHQHKKNISEKLTEKCVSAIRERMKELPYQHSLDCNNVSYSEYFWFLYKKLNSDIAENTGDWKTAQTLNEIIESRDNYKKTGEEGLFNNLLEMDKPFLIERYNSLMGKNHVQKKKFVDGTYFNKNNVEFIVYYALTSANPNLASHNRQEIINGINALPRNLSGYFRDLKLQGLACNYLQNELKGSPLGILQIFDKYYQKKTGDKSLFDLNEKTHLHPWGDKFQAPQRYMCGELGEQAILHSVKEQYSGLNSNSREEVIKTIKGMKKNLKEIIQDIRIKTGAKKMQDSRIQLLRLIDKNYQTRTGDKSLFDLNEKTHLHEWMDEFKAPEKYWKNPENIDKVIEHKFLEENPKLLSTNRTTVLEGLNEMPSDKAKYFSRLGFSGFMNKKYMTVENSTVTVLKWFDKRTYQKRTGDKSLFDITQSQYAYFGSRNKVFVNF